MRHLTVSFAISCVLLVTLTALSMEAIAQDQEERQVKLFSLENARAEDLLPIIHELFMVDGKVRMACDRRSNTLVASGPPSDLQVIEAILMRLDITVAEPSNESPSNSDKPSASDGTNTHSSENDVDVTIGYPLSGSAILISIAEDQQLVEKGEVIAVLQVDMRDEHANLESELASLRAQAAQLSDHDALEMGQAIAEQHIKLAQMRMEQAKAESALEQESIEGEIAIAIESARLLRHALEVLMRTEDRSAEQDPRAHIDVRLELVKAEQQLNLLKKKKQLLSDHVQRVRLAELKAEHNRAELELRRIQQEAATQQQAIQAERDAVNLHMQLVADRLKRIHDASRQTTIRAPIGGVVTRVDGVQKGVSIRRQQPILTIRAEK